MSEEISNDNALQNAILARSEEGDFSDNSFPNQKNDENSK